jgi:hypothetical protein
VEVICAAGLGPFVSAAVSVHPDNPYFSMLGDFLVDHGGTLLVRYCGRSVHLCVPKEIQILGESCFECDGQVETLTFEEGSCLRRIEWGAFADTSLKKLSLPASVEYINGGAFRSCSLESLTIDPRNPYFTCDNGWLIQTESKTLILALSGDSHIMIPLGVSSIGPEALLAFSGVRSIDFAAPSSVTAIHRYAFADLSIASLRVPPSVRHIHRSAIRGVMAEAIAIDEANPYFYLEGECVIERGTHRLVQCLSRRPQFVVPSTIQIIGAGAFAQSGIGLSITAIHFQENSQLRRIEKCAFQWSGLVSLTLPSDLEFLNGRTFSECDLHSLTIASGNRHFEMRGGFLVKVPQQRLIRYFGRDHDIIIPNDIVSLGEYCLFNCSNLTSISFEAGSHLSEIEHCAILHTDLPTFRIPASVSKIHGSAFGGCTTRIITVDETNPHFCVDGDFLHDSERRQVIRYFGGSSDVCIDERIEVLAPGCFYAHPLLVHCDFRAGSKLRSVKEQAFWNSSILDITLPPGVCDVEQKAFRRTCHVSIPGVPPDEEIEFRNWQCRHRCDPSVVLDLGYV